MTEAQVWAMIAGFMTIMIAMLGVVRAMTGRMFASLRESVNDLRASIDVRFDSFQRQMDARFDTVETRIDHLDRDIAAIIRDRPPM